MPDMRKGTVATEDVMAMSTEPTHKIGFKGWDIVCRCGAEFGSAQREAMNHVKAQAAHAKEVVREAAREDRRRVRALKREQKVNERRQAMAYWRRTRDLARVFGIGMRTARRWLRAQGPLHAQVRRPTKRKDFEWRAVVG